jgi:GNAT superfamily N-acetyltransferase
MLNIRQATAEDVPTLHSLIQEMAEYEHLPLLITEQILTNDGFGVQAKFRVLIAEFGGNPAGYAFFFDSYSTFQGRSLFLEDLFVRPEFRKNKIGRALFSRVAAIAIQENCFGIMLHALDRNELGNPVLQEDGCYVPRQLENCLPEGQCIADCCWSRR